MFEQTNKKIKFVEDGGYTWSGTGEDQSLYLTKHIDGTMVVTVNGEPFSDYVINEGRLHLKVGDGDDISVSYQRESYTTTWRKYMDSYIESIGGLRSGYYTDKPPIMSVNWVGDGWLPLLKELIQELIDDGWDRQICDIKEKFGTLRFYTNGGGENHYDIITRYENRSAHVCERCGQPGELRTTGWYKTLCDYHNENRNEHEQEN
jgi:hypothetical protein